MIDASIITDSPHLLTAHGRFCFVEIKLCQERTRNLLTAVANSCDMEEWGGCEKMNGGIKKFNHAMARLISRICEAQQATPPRGPI
jgi:hypothetical protein